MALLQMVFFSGLHRNTGFTYGIFMVILLYLCPNHQQPERFPAFWCDEILRAFPLGFLVHALFPLKQAVREGLCVGGQLAFLVTIHILLFQQERHELVLLYTSSVSFFPKGRYKISCEVGRDDRLASIIILRGDLLVKIKTEKKVYKLTDYFLCKKTKRPIINHFCIDK